METIRTSLLVQMVQVFFIVLVLGMLQFRLRPRSFHRFWFLSWTGYALFTTAGVISLALGREPSAWKTAVLWFSVVGGLLHPAFLLLALTEVEPRPPRTRPASLHVALGVVAVGTVVWAFAQFGGLPNGAGAFARQLPRQSLVACACLATSWVLLRARRTPGEIALRVIGVSCGLWAITSTFWALSSISAFLVRLGHPPLPFASPDPDSLLLFSDVPMMLGIGTGMILLIVEETRRTSRELMEATSAYRALVDASPVGILAVDPTGRVTLANAAVAAFFGQPLPSLIGAPSPCLDDSGQASALRRALGGERVEGTPCERMHADGRHVVGLASAAPLLDATNTVRGAICIVADTTELHRLEEEVRRAQKMEAVGRLAGGIAHDFNNLLTVVLGSAHLLAAELDRDDARQEEVQEIREAAERAAELTQRLLAFARPKPAQLAPLDLNVMVQEMHRLLSRLLAAPIECQLELDPALPPVIADRGPLEQIVTNLCLNARDAMPRGGTLAIRTAACDAEGGVTGVFPPLPPGRYLSIEVADTGAGIPPDVLAHVFEPFFSTKDPGKGTGLGLATVYSNVEQLGGQLRINSVVGRGTTVTVVLPIAAVPAEAATIGA